MVREQELFFLFEIQECLLNASIYTQEKESNLY